MITLDDISTAVISIIRLGAVFRFIYCMIRLQGAEEEQAQYKKAGEKHRPLLYHRGICLADQRHCILLLRFIATKMIKSLVEIRKKVLYNRYEIIQHLILYSFKRMC